MEWSDLDEIWIAKSVPDEINGKRVLGFLQNPWFPVGTSERTIKLYREAMAYRRAVLSMSRTGKWLTRTLGPDIYWKVWWDNANPSHGHTYDHEEVGDPGHMATVVHVVQPHVVMLFGRQARTGWLNVKAGWPGCDMLPTVIYAPHPMARGNQIPALEALSERLREELR